MITIKMKLHDDECAEIDTEIIINFYNEWKETQLEDYEFNERLDGFIQDFIDNYDAPVILSNREEKYLFSLLKKNSYIRELIDGSK